MSGKGNEIYPNPDRGTLFDPVRSPFRILPRPAPEIPDRTYRIRFEGPPMPTRSGLSPGSVVFHVEYIRIFDVVLG